MGGTRKRKSHLCVVRAEIKIVDLLLVGIDFVRPVEIREGPDPENAVVSTRGHVLIVGTQTDHFLVRLGHAEEELEKNLDTVREKMRNSSQKTLT